MEENFEKIPCMEENFPSSFHFHFQIVRAQIAKLNT